MTQILREIKEAGLIYDPVITGMIVGYEAGHMQRNCFYAAMCGDSVGEQELKAGWLANARVELSDLITQARVLAAVYGWTWDELVNTGEAKLLERIETYQQRGVRPQEALMKSFMQYMNADITSPEAVTTSRRRPQRDGD